MVAHTAEYKRGNNNFNYAIHTHSKFHAPNELEESIVDKTVALVANNIIIFSRILEVPVCMRCFGIKRCMAKTTKPNVEQKKNLKCVREPFEQ